jgi:hypothetical protein
MGVNTVTLLRSRATQASTTVQTALRSHEAAAAKAEPGVLKLLGAKQLTVVSAERFMAADGNSRDDLRVGTRITLSYRGQQLGPIDVPGLKVPPRQGWAPVNNADYAKGAAQALELMRSAGGDVGRVASEAFRAAGGV